jgi:hypothetical protein
MIQRLCFAGWLVSLTAAACFGQTFTETFEGGIPASWTIHDNFPLFGVPIPAFSAVPWTVNTAEGMLNYTNGGGATGAGTAATASSHNHPGQYDVSLITPTFPITAAIGGNALNYTINFRRVDAFEAFDTNLSLNGGPWITMNHQTSSEGPAYSTGAPKVLHGFDLSFFGAVPGDLARVEFRYFSTFLLPMVHNEYVEIDDVRIPTPIPEPASVMLALMALAAVWRLRCSVRRIGPPRLLID